MKKLIVIDNEVCEVARVHYYGYLPILELTDGREYYISETHEDAGEVARDYWEELAATDPEEFACLVGEKTLVRWALNQLAGPGSTQVRNLNEWLDLWLDTPEEQWASYDGIEIEGVKFNRHLADEIGYESGPSVVLYRCN